MIMTNNHVDISIIIPVYNVEHYIIECLQSVYAQKNIDGTLIEVIIVDDRGNDASMDVAKGYINSIVTPFKTSIITRDNNGGLSAARNSGILAAQGTYLYFLDSDDFISNDCISILWNEVQTHPNVDIVYGYAECFPNQEIMHKYFDNSRKIKSVYLEGDNLKKAYFSIPDIAWNKLIRKDYLLSNNLFFKEGIIHEDYHWHFRAYCSIKGAAFPADKKSTYFYRQHSGTITDMSKGDKYKENMEILYLDLFHKTDYIHFVDTYLMRQIIFILTELDLSSIRNRSFKYCLKQVYKSTPLHFKQKLILSLMQFLNKRLYIRLFKLLHI